MNIVILINPQKYIYHFSIAKMIDSILNQQNHNTTILDINDSKFDHLCLAKLNFLAPDILITLDLSGFRFQTQSGENALNMLTTKNLNIIWGNRPEYTNFLNKKISLSMLFYDASGINNQLPQIFPYVLYYKALGKINITSEFVQHTSYNQEVFLAIWKDFLKEVLLSET